MSSDVRKAVIVNLAKMDFNANLLRDWGLRFDTLKESDTFTDRYGREFYIDGEKDTWETLYASPLSYYRSQIYEIIRLLPDVEKREELENLFSVFSEISSKKKRGILREKDDYQGKAKLLAKFADIHDMLKAYIKTSMNPIVSDEELREEFSKIENRVREKHSESRYQQTQIETGITPSNLSAGTNTSYKPKEELISTDEQLQPNVAVKFSPEKLLIELKSAEENITNQWKYLKGHLDSAINISPMAVSIGDELLPLLAELKKYRDTYDGLLSENENLNDRQRNLISKSLGEIIKIYEVRISREKEMQSQLSVHR